MVIPSGTSLVLVDDASWGASQVVAGRQARPFLERAGQYWGPPPDDDTAVHELERLRQAGAGFIVFAWPSFWWLDHYVGFRRYLEATYPRVLANERLVIFDLQRLIGAAPSVQVSAVEP